MKKWLLLFTFLHLTYLSIGQNKLPKLYKSPCEDLPTRLYADSEYTSEIDLKGNFENFLDRIIKTQVSGIRYLNFKQQRSLGTFTHDSTKLFGDIVFEIPGEKFEKANLQAFIEIVKKDNKAIIRIYDIYYRYDFTNCIITFKEFSENALGLNSLYKEHHDIKVNEKDKYKCEQVKFIDEKMQRLLKELKTQSQM